MALVPATLAKQLFDAETAGVTLTAEASAKIQARCLKVATAIDTYIKTATINSTVAIPSTSPPGTPSMGEAISTVIS